MGRLDEDLNCLLSIKGFGEGRIATLRDTVGGKDTLIRMLTEGDVTSLSSVERISERMAVELVLAFRGEDPGSILRTEGSRSVYQSISELIRSYMQTPSGKNRTSLLLPCGDLRSREIMARDHFEMGSMVEDVDREEVRRCLLSVGKGQRSRRTNARLNYILIVEDDEAYQRVREMGLDRRCLVLSPDEMDPAAEGELVLVHNLREMDESQIPIAASVHMDSAPERIVPETVLDRYGGRMEQLRSLSRLQEIFSMEGASPMALGKLEQMNSLTKEIKGPDEIRETVEDIRSKLESAMKERIEDLTLSGSDTLSLLSSDEPPALREIYREHSKKAAEMVFNELGQRRDLFSMGYPLKVDESSLERMISDIEEEAAGERFRRKQDMAIELADLWEQVKEEIKWALDLDFRFGMGCFIKDHELQPFKAVNGWLGIYHACHLMIRSTNQRQLIDYHLGSVPGFASIMFPFRENSRSRTSLLTGANSGGKTTLLETLAQIMIMARMGLPVPADKAFLPDITDIFFYKPRRRLDAGGLEGFLKELLPLVLDVDQGSLVLADELEAMTELEAASRVIGVFVDELQKRDAYSVVVTHMADEILRFVDCRVDGIEARGLDEGHELIVDRSPMIGKHARSTPELILRKLEARSKGKEKEIYSTVLSKFDQ